MYRQRQCSCGWTWNYDPLRLRHHEWSCMVPLTDNTVYFDLLSLVWTINRRELVAKGVASANAKRSLPRSDLGYGKHSSAFIASHASISKYTVASQGRTAWVALPNGIGLIIFIDHRGSYELRWALVKLPKCHDAWDPKKEHGNSQES